MHQRRPDEETVDQRRQAIDIVAGADPGFGNQDAVGSEAGKPLGRRDIHAEVAKITIVDADERGAEAQRAAHLHLVVDLDQRIHAEAARFGDHLTRGRVVEERQHHQHRVGSGDARLDDLARIDEEILGEDRAVELTAGGGKVVERSTEKFAVAQHAQAVGDPGITPRERGGIGRRSDRAGRG